MSFASCSSAARFATGLAAVLVVSATAARADVVFDFATASISPRTAEGSGNWYVPSSTAVLVNGVHAEGFVYNATSASYTLTALWQRDQTNDHGLGVCSEGASTCKSGAGDVNELDNAGYDEVIRLALPAGFKWTSLYVSSLDSGGSNGKESGILYWSDSPTPNLATLSTNFHFHYGMFGTAVEGNLFSASSPTFPASFDSDAKYLFFRADPGNYTGTGSLKTENNDYLVWKGSVAPVPEPSTAGLLLGGLVVTAALGRRRMRRG